MSEVPSKPWMHDSEINLIIAFLNKEQSMLEWGCGGSTMLFSKYVKKYYSIEHNKEWYDKVNDKIKKDKIKNIQNYHIPTEDGGPDFPSTPDRYKTYIEKY